MSRSLVPPLPPHVPSLWCRDNDPQRAQMAIVDANLMCGDWKPASRSESRADSMVSWMRSYHVKGGNLVAGIIIMCFCLIGSPKNTRK